MLHRVTARQEGGWINLYCETHGDRCLFGEFSAAGLCGTASSIEGEGDYPLWVEAVYDDPSQVGELPERWKVAAR